MTVSIYETRDLNEIWELYKAGINESLPNRSEYQFLFSWNYNRLDEEGKWLISEKIAGRKLKRHDITKRK